MARKSEGGALLQVVVLTAALLAMVLDGWVVAKLWHWFVEPLGVVALPLWNAVGLTILVAVPLRYMSKDAVDERTSSLERLYRAVVSGLALLGLGWLAHFGL